MADLFYLYMYTNQINGKRYIGVTNDYDRRCYEHRHGRGGARRFSNAIKKYGYDNFRVEVLALFDDVGAACYHEQAAIISFKTLSPNGYNLMAGAPFTEYCGPHTVEHTKKIRNANLGLKRSPEICAMIGRQKKGQKAWNKGKQTSEESIEKMSIAHKKWFENSTPEKKEAMYRKISMANKGKIRSEECRKKLSRIATGRKATAETKRILSEAHKGLELSPGAIKHQFKPGHVSQNKGIPLSEEAKRKMSEKLKGHAPWNKGIKTGQIPWNKGKPGLQVPWNKGKKGLQVAWNKGIKGSIPWNKGIPCSEETKRKLSEAAKARVKE